MTAQEHNEYIEALRSIAGSISRGLSGITADNAEKQQQLLQSLENSSRSIQNLLKTLDDSINGLKDSAHPDTSRNESTSSTSTKDYDELNINISGFKTTSIRIPM